jgi:predicted kinase
MNFGLGNVQVPELPPAEGPRLSFGDRFAAQRTAAAIELDSWGHRGRREYELRDEITRAIGPDPNPGFIGRIAPSAVPVERLLDRAARSLEGVPDAFRPPVPTSREAFDAEIDRRLQREYQDQQDVLARAPDGGWFPELLGGLSAGVTDESTVLTLPLGAGAGSIAKVAATEAIAGVAAEALTLPRQYEMAETLGLPAPNPIEQLAVAGVTGGVLGGGMAAAPRVLSFGAERWQEYRGTRQTADLTQRPEGVTPVEQEKLIAQAEVALDRNPGGRALTADDFPVNAAPIPRAGDAPHATIIEFAMGPNRPNAPNQPVLDTIGRAVEEVLGPGATVRVISGQEGDLPQFGSNRHSTGDAADIAIITADGRMIRATDPEMAEIARAAARNGAQGIGFGADYMGGDHIHIDLVTPGPGQGHAWGAGANAIENELVATMQGSPGARRAPPPIASFPTRGSAEANGNPVGYVYGRLLAMGYEPHIVAGLVGNLMQESGPTLNPRSTGDSGNAFGIAQWNGPRRVAYLAYAQRRGVDPADLDTQIAYLDHELRTSEASAWAAIRSAPDAETAARLASELFWRPGIPMVDRRMAYARELSRQYQDGRVPRWQAGQVTAPAEGPTFRGYTGTDQVRYGEGRRIDVTYQVVDARLLQQASGDLQPRDRSQARSDLWVNQTAADLDPALLMRSPTADRGAPIVGPDDIIESGNGRILAIQRAYAQFPDRAAAYRGEIEKAGFTIPAGIEEPVLIARRSTPFNAAERVGFVQAAQDSGVAVMTAAERAKIGRQALTADTLDLYRPAAKLNSADNRDFARRFVAAYPPSQQGSFIANDKSLSTDGIRQLRDAIFARAYEADDILRRYIEEDPGELKSLLDALATAAPDVAMLRAAIEADLVRPDMDIIPFVLDAARLIMNARDIAAREGGKPAAILDELLADTNLLGDVVPPLTAALVGKMMPGGKQAPADTIASFLIRYSRDALAAGRVADPFAADGPLAVLKAIDPATFGDLTETGRAASAQPPPEPVVALDTAVLPEFDDGALSPAAIAADDLMVADLRATIQEPSQPFSISARLDQLFTESAELQDALQRQAAVPLTTDLPGYGSDTFWQQRRYISATGEEIIGRDAAVVHLGEVSRSLAWVEDGLSPEPVLRNRHATILIGPPASGKSSIANPMAQRLRASIIDADEAKKLIPEYDRGVGANAVHEESSDIAASAFDEAVINGENLVLPKVGGKPASIERTITTLKSAGYRVDLVEVSAEPAIVIDRMIGRFQATGRFIPPQIMIDGIEGPPRTYQILKDKGVADANARIDNNPGRGEPRGIIEDEQGILSAFTGAERGNRNASGEPVRRDNSQADGSDARPLDAAAAPSTDQALPATLAALRNVAGDLRATVADLRIEMPDKTTMSIAEFLDDLDADDIAQSVIDACTLGRTG